MKTQYQPLLYAVLLSGGLLIGYLFNPGSGVHGLASSKLERVLGLVDAKYVDSVNLANLEEKAVESFMQQLDPHSVYMPAQELQAANDELRGEFEGIGVEFNIFNDTVLVVTVISGGPADKAGLLAGDRIIKVEDKNIAGVSLENAEVIKLLKGPKGTKVNVKILRSGIQELMPFTITRGKIPLNSVAAAYLMNDGIGYVKIIRFSGTTTDEVRKALLDLKEGGMKSLILDMRGNPGGYLSAAKDVADEFLGGNKLIVYTQGRTQPRREYKADKPGIFEDGKMVVLMDENSASASEIVAGALQDWDRAPVVGRRSFGKGLVQESFDLKDGSAIRLTISRYFTPLGRSIQRSYKNGTEAYRNDWEERYVHQELFTADSLPVNDSSQVFITPAGKKLYGAGGIYPDVFIALDTSFNVRLYNQLVSRQIITRSAHEYANLYKKSLPSDVKLYCENWKDDEKIKAICKQKSAESDIKLSSTEWQAVWPRLHTQIMAMIARQAYGETGYVYVVNRSDKAIETSISLLK